MLKYLFFIFIIFFPKSIDAQITMSTMTDSRDFQVYKTVTITKSVGFDVVISHTWMTENLNYQMGDSYCYNDIPENCKKYGRLYSKSAAIKACPPGWHLSTLTEWQRLIHQFAKGGEENLAYEALTTNEFAAQLSGVKTGMHRKYYHLNESGSYWVQPNEETDELGVYNFGRVNYYGYSKKPKLEYEFRRISSKGNSCRCVKDEE